MDCKRHYVPMHPDDVSLGFQRRMVRIRINRRSLVCDDCGEPLNDAADAVAVTMWRGEFEFAAWEHDYGVIL